MLLSWDLPSHGFLTICKIMHNLALILPLALLSNPYSFIYAYTMAAYIYLLLLAWQCQSSRSYIYMLPFKNSSSRNSVSRSLGLKLFNSGYNYNLEKAMAPHSSTLAWKIPWTEEPGGLRSMGSLGVGHSWATSLSLFAFMHWRRKWQPTPVFLPGESRGQKSWVGCCLWGRTESDTTEVT